MRVLNLSVLMGLHASKVKIPLKATDHFPEISPKTAIMMKHYPYVPYMGERVRRVMEANAIMKKHASEWTWDSRGVYWVNWMDLSTPTVWRANFLDYESYLRFVTKPGVKVVEQGYREVI